MLSPLKKQIREIASYSVSHIFQPRQYVTELSIVPILRIGTIRRMKDDNYSVGSRGTMLRACSFLFWYKSATVTVPGPTLGADDFQIMHFTSGWVRAAKETARLNRIAAILTAAASFLGALSSVSASLLS
jgi:hypothetical protein